MDKESLPSILQSPILIRAMEELEMLSKTDVEREQYESRRKFQLDYNTGMMEARLEGEAKGKAEGEAKVLMEVIRLCQRLLNRLVSSTEELARLTAAELTQLSSDLQSEVLKNK